MLKEVTTEKTGNDRFEGYAIDLIDELSKLLGFKYEFILQEDADYGVPIEGTDRWTGMLGAIMEDVSSLCNYRSHSNNNVKIDGIYFIQRADLGITDLTVRTNEIQNIDCVNE